MTRLTIINLLIWSEIILSRYYWHSIYILFELRGTGNLIIRLAASSDLIRGRTFVFRCGVCHNELGLFKLAFSLIELVDVVLFLFLLDHELDAFVG